MDAERRTEMMSSDIFSIFERISGRTWSWFALGSILISLFLFLTGRRSWALFIGQWPPTFLATALFFRLLGPAEEPGEISSLRGAASQTQRTMGQMRGQMGGSTRMGDTGSMAG